jgi:UDP-N-acetylglucosamine transferase subunit ALG13
LILVTFGTHPQPFDRALDWVLDAVVDEELVVQHGSTPPRPGAGPQVEWHELLTYERIVELIRAADAVVGHAGVGTLMTAIELGRTPVAIPRLREHGEHVDDHQLDIAREMSSAGYVIACSREGELAEAIERARNAGLRSRDGAGDLRRVAILAAGGDPDRL